MIVSESRTRKEIKKTTKKKKKRIPRNDNIEWNHRPTEYRRRKKMIKFRMSKDSDSMMIKYRFFYFLSFIQWTKTISRKQKLERNGTDRTNEWMNESNRKQQQQNDSKVYLYISIYFIYGNEINNPRKRIRFE